MGTLEAKIVVATVIVLVLTTMVAGSLWLSHLQKVKGE